MTLRQVWVRVRSLSYDSPLMGALRDEDEKAKEQRRADELDDALTRYKRKG